MARIRHKLLLVQTIAKHECHTLLLAQTIANHECHTLLLAQTCANHEHPLQNHHLRFIFLSYPRAQQPMLRSLVLTVRVATN